MRRLVGVLAAAMVLGGCSSGGSSPGPGPGPHPDGNLVKTADLAPCPRSSSTPVSGGLPAITLECLAPGRPVHMAGLTGKPTVVNIWGSWCIPCQKEEKYFASAYSRLKGKVRFLGVDSVDSADSALDFLAHVRPAVHFPSVFDADRKILLGVGRAGPPVTVFLDRSGKIVGKSSDYTSLNDLYADIANYLHVTA